MNFIVFALSNLIDLDSQQNPGVEILLGNLFVNFPVNRWVSENKASNFSRVEILTSRQERHATTPGKHFSEIIIGTSLRFYQ